MIKNKLFEESEDSDKEVQFNTNKDYAKSYNKFRQKELLKKYKDRGLDVSDSDSSDESDSTDEDEIIDPKFDKEFFKTLSSLKSKDPSIYDKNTKFFDGLDQVEETLKKKESTKPVTLKDYERKILLENGGKFEEDSDKGDEEMENDGRAASPTYVEEQKRLKAEFKKVVNADDSEEEEFGGIFKKRVKSKEEKDKEEADFTKWLAGKKDDVEEDVKKTLEPLKNYWSNSKLPQQEKFLRDYILNQGYVETCVAHIPTYEEVVGEVKNFSEDEKELEKQEEFEHKYNFRFEEPDSEFIKRYPRTIEKSVRKKDDTRKQKRQETKERKEREKEQKMNELQLLKLIKRKEIEEKIRKLKAVTGNDELGFKGNELDDEFDPDAHDKRMQEIFNDEYYGVDEGEEKPGCPNIDELKVEDWDNYDPLNANFGCDYEPHCEDDDFNMDCDYDPNSKETIQKELIESTRDKRKKRKRNRFMEVIKAEKPVFNPDDEKTYGEYIDEYYQLDCEDVIGDLPCRFKYTETTPNDFGLTIEEILLAKNKELNQWASLKKAIQIRPEAVEKREQKLYKMKANNDFLKRKIFKSLYGEESDEEADNDQQTAKKRKIDETVTASEGVPVAKKVAKVESGDTNEGDVEDSGEDPIAAFLDRNKTKKKKKKKIKLANGKAGDVTAASLEKKKEIKPAHRKVGDTTAASLEKKKKIKPAHTKVGDAAAASLEKKEKTKGAHTKVGNVTAASVVAADSSKTKKEKKQETKPANGNVGDATVVSLDSKTKKEKKKKTKHITAKIGDATAAPAVAVDSSKTKKEEKQETKPANANIGDATAATVDSSPTKKEATQKNKPTNAKVGDATAASVDSSKPIKKKTKPTNAQATEKESTSTPSKTTKTIKKLNKNPFSIKKILPASKIFKNIRKGNINDRNKQNKFSSKQTSKNKYKLHRTGDDAVTNITDDRLKAYGINPKKFHKQQKYGNKNA